MKPPLKWAGGKAWLVPRIAPIWKSLDKPPIVEPFMGSAAVTLALSPSSAILGDSLAPLACFMKEWLSGRLHLESRRPTPEVYLALRREFNGLVRQDEYGLSGYLSSTRVAWLFWELNRWGFNGLCRFNRKGEFNVPPGRGSSDHAKLNKYDGPTKVTVCCAPWASTVDLALSGDLIYADPPYDTANDIYGGEFGWHEQLALAGRLARLPNPVIASNRATKRILELYQDWGFKVTAFDGPVRISCDGDRTPMPEMFATKRCSSG